MTIIRQIARRAPKSLKQPIAVFRFEYQKNQHVQSHSHDFGQLIYASEGCLKIISSDNYWIIPPQRGVWVPPNIEHEVITLTDISMETVLVDSRKNTPFHKDRCSVVSITPLMRELIVIACDYMDNYKNNSAESRLLRVLQDQLSLLSIEPLMLPRLQNSKLKKIVNGLEDNPDDSRTLDDWGNVVGASSRTLSRLFRQNAKMSFQQWRTQFKLLKAIELLALKNSVQQVSEALGYANPGAFIHMFHKELGVTPRQYFK